MIVRFSTRFGQLTMHGEAAVALLRGMGHSGTVPGAIMAADLPDALQRLQRMLDSSGDTSADAPSPQDDADDDEDREPAIRLRTRAVPLIDMMRTAIERNSDLMWERA